jgi:hypothetical protein
MPWLDILGWGGSALLVFSLLQSRVLRFRVLNTLACLALLVFNALIEVWPMVGMNLVLTAINLYFIVRLLREQHDEAVFGVIEVGTDEAFLRHLLATHAADIAKFQPDLAWDPVAPGGRAFVVVKGDEAVGVVLLEVEGTDALVRLDYVTPRYRDFSPGEFVWRRSDTLRGLGVTRVVTPAGMVGAYYDRLGFHADGPSYVLEL